MGFVWGYVRGGGANGHFTLVFGPSPMLWILCDSVKVLSSSVELKSRWTVKLTGNKIKSTIASPTFKTAEVNLHHSQCYLCQCYKVWHTALKFFPTPVADPRGAPGPPPTDQNFLNFMQFFGKIWQTCMLAHPPPRGLAPPPTGNPGSAPEHSL